MARLIVEAVTAEKNPEAGGGDTVNQLLVYVSVSNALDGKAVVSFIYKPIEHYLKR